MKKKVTTFSMIVEFINTHQVGNLIFRTELLQVNPNASQPSIDSIRLMLTRADYLTITDYPGHYKLLKKIPTDLSSTKLRKIAYPKNISNFCRKRIPSHNF